MKRIIVFESFYAKEYVNLIGQILKNRYNIQDKIPDTGCETGKNLHWFLRNEFEIYGIDSKSDIINLQKQDYPRYQDVHCLIT